jgi:hypothetical protein
MSAHLLGLKLARVALGGNGVLVLLNENLLAHASLWSPIFLFFSFFFFLRNVALY